MIPPPPSPWNRHLHLSALVCFDMEEDVVCGAYLVGLCGELRLSGSLVRE